MQPKQKKNYIRPQLKTEVIILEENITATSVIIRGTDENEFIELMVYPDLDLDREPIIF